MYVTVKARVYTDTTGAFTEIPVLLTSAGVLLPLAEYCVKHSHDRSITWMRDLTRALTMFLQYLNANPAERESYKLFQNFAQRLYTGTFNRETGMDPSWLCWAPRPTLDARYIITQLTEFFDSVADDRPAAAKVNPRTAANAYDRMMNEAAYQYRRSRAFLGHLWSARAPKVGHLTGAERVPKVPPREPPAFPDDRFNDLLLKGFKVGSHYNYRDMLITLLLHGAGFRESEPFHLYVGDVFPDPAADRRAMVLIHHPIHGDAPSDWCDKFGQPKKGKRYQYLAEKFGGAPRTKMMNSRAAGWKGGMHDAAFYKQAHWFLPEYGELFLQLWHLYLNQVARVERNHPFAFINLRRAPFGGMYCLAQYNKAHAAACRRIGLTVAKARGTTPHGHRYAYAQRLKNAGVGEKFIQRFLHHSSSESQKPYTEPTMSEMVRAIQDGAQRLRASITEKSAPQIVALSGFDLND